MAHHHILTEADVTAADGAAREVLQALLNQSRRKTDSGSIISYRATANKSVLCLIHGFGGDPVTTFGKMPELITADDSLRGWDLLSIGYSTELLPDIGQGIWSADPDISKIAGFLTTYLQILFGQYQRVALLGHSMGGLVIQRALLNMQDISRISNVLLYGTPSGGLRKATFIRWLKRQASDMDIDGRFIRELRSDWTQRFGSDYPFRFATIAGESDEFVPPTVSLSPFPPQYHHYTSGNHIGMVKPVDASELSFLILKGQLSDSPGIYGGRPEDRSNLHAHYLQQVNSLGARLNELDSKGFKAYIFALEGLGRLEEAIETLEQSALLQHNTDCMGILGGRYKRKYLLEQTSESLEKAIHWYEAALQLSTQAANSGQMYYHAINLAFLYLMRDETDLRKPREMAQLALQQCALDPGTAFWKTATQAEAHLYLGEFDQAKKLYAAAIAQSGGDLRAISSMRLNALYACDSLHRADWRQVLQQLLGT